MNASEAHLPINIRVYVGIPAMCIIMAAPERFKCVPTSLLLKPRMGFPIASTAALMSCKISVLVIFESLVPS